MVACEENHNSHVDDLVERAPIRCIPSLLQPPIKFTAKTICVDHQPQLQELREQWFQHGKCFDQGRLKAKTRRKNVKKLPKGGKMEGRFESGEKTFGKIGSPSDL